jgi:hypothetical protein
MLKSCRLPDGEAMTQRLPTPRALISKQNKTRFDVSREWEERGHLGTNQRKEPEHGSNSVSTCAVDSLKMAQLRGRLPILDFASLCDFCEALDERRLAVQVGLRLRGPSLERASCSLRRPNRSKSVDEGTRL